MSASRKAYADVRMLDQRDEAPSSFFFASQLDERPL